MKFPVFIAIVILFNVQLTAHSQSHEKWLLKIDSLKAALDRADSLSPFNFDIENVNDSISMLHEEIHQRLSEILTAPAAMQSNLDSLLQHPELAIARSDDKRLWIFSWYENTGGSFHSYMNLVHYRTVSNNSNVRQAPALEESSLDDGVFSLGFSYDTIYRLKSAGKDLYLCLGGAKTCNTCYVHAAVVVELTKDSIRFDYPAFIDSYDGNTVQYSSTFLLDARIGSVECFQFDPKTQTLSFRYRTDDNTPVKSDDEKIISRRLKFDGKKFKGNGYE